MTCFSPYRGISEHYKHRFGERVFKIPLSIADDCPNRQGLRGMQLCLFCDEWGSSAKQESLQMSLQEQLEKYHKSIAFHYKVGSFLAYFQSYTSTFQSFEKLKHHVQTALSYPYIRGFVLGTRPDSISKAVLQWLSQYQISVKGDGGTYVSVELGVQSFRDDILKFLQRGHSVAQSMQTIRKLRESGVEHIGIHLIFGCPEENDDDAVNAARLCNELQIHSVKLHHLHVLKNTLLENLYRKGEFKPIAFETYANRISVFLEHLNPNIFIHRLSAYAPRWDELISPEWTKDKKKTHQHIIDIIFANKTYQGRLYNGYL